MNGEPADDPLIGMKIGPCRVELRLAAGGMGVVYRARHLQLDQDVAIKILAPSLAQDQEYVTRFFREAGAAGQIDHPNVVRVIDVGRHEDKYFLVMEFVEGETLDHIIDRERRLPMDRATKFVREIAAGLAAAHRAGIIHRDVKPGNIIVSPDGRPHLTDFGLARHTETRKGLTIEGTFLGTPEYASPEQVEGRRLDHRTDLYSLGVTYYQLLSGTLPFLGESPMEIAIKRTKEDPRPLENALPGADPRVCSLMKKLLQMEAGQRPQSATDLIRELDSILSGEKSTGASKKTETTKSTRGPFAGLTAKRRIQALVHWDLVLNAMTLAFLSGGLAARGGEFLEMWGAKDPDLTLRIALGGAALVFAAGAILIHVKESFAVRTWVGMGGVLGLMLVSALAAGAMIDRADASTAPARMANSFRSILDALAWPANLLAGGGVLLFAAAVIAYEHEPGSSRVAASRVLIIASFVLFFAFGCSRGLMAPLKDFMAQPELSIPLATATILACIFGLLLLGGYNFEAGARTFGLVLCLAGAAGLFSFAVLVTQPEVRVPGKTWMDLLSEPFSDFGRSAKRAGTLLAAALALALVERSVLAAGLRRLDRVRRKF
jgi:hypothetical protein